MKNALVFALLILAAPVALAFHAPSSLPSALVPAAGSPCYANGSRVVTDAATNASVTSIPVVSVEGVAVLSVLAEYERDSGSTGSTAQYTVTCYGRVSSDDSTNQFEIPRVDSDGLAGAGGITKDMPSAGSTERTALRFYVEGVAPYVYCETTFADGDADDDFSVRICYGG